MRTWTQWIQASRGHLAVTSGDTFDGHDWRGGGVRLASCGWRPGMLLHALKTHMAAPQTMTRAHSSEVPT